MQTNVEVGASGRFEVVAPEPGRTDVSPHGPQLLIPEARGRQARRHRRLTIIVFALAFGLVVVTAVAIVLFRGSQSGSEGVPASPAQLQVDSAACQSEWTGLRSQLAGSGPPSLPEATVSDVRGSYTALLYMEPDGGNWLCFLSSPSSVVGLEGSPDGSFSRTPTATDPLTLSSPALFTNVDATFQLVEGQAARYVSSITLTLSDGTVVHPTLRGGFFIAFWPGTASAVSSTYRIGNATHQAGGAPTSPSQEFGNHPPPG